MYSRRNIQELPYIKRQKKAEEKLKKEKDNYFKNYKSIFSDPLRLFSFLAWCSLSYGVLSQKGLIEGMHLGNLKGSYEVQEILYSALHTFFFTANFILDKMRNLKEATYLGYKDLWLIYLAGFFIALYIMKLFFYVSQKPNKINSFVVSAITKTPEKITKKRYYIPLIAILSQSFALIITPIFGLIIILLLSIPAILMLPLVTGLYSGQAMAKDAKSNPPCHQTKDIKPINNEYFQCTHVTIKGKTLRGRILLETDKGYFMRLNHAFIFVSKSGEHCIYSKDQAVTEKNKDTFVFEKTQVDDFCGKVVIARDKTKTK